ncbi:MAG TPA: glutamine-hydrolyzing carbamoyl-phosphate synthase small subunit [Candidatus Limivicinus faecipullorum]|nr:glutamine-hydrolyzing carbamoyl-phosphate synthase small subunit [Candidatus Limivicinus faecipullorum]
MEKANLVLSNGMVFEGQAIGAVGESIGELVFTTGMVGYMETLTDPSYAGQIIMQTFPLIGNYGVIPEDFEGDCFARGYVVRELAEQPSNFRSQYELDRFLKERGVCGICGVDTRQITRIIREEGVMNAGIFYELPAELRDIQSYSCAGAVALVSHREKRVFPARGQEKFTVALIDYGAKQNIIRCLCARGCKVISLPFDVTAEEVLSLGVDGVMLSNGPGDPKENVRAIAEIKKLLGKLPVFGICLGHQLTALALGGDTVKLKYGHRGANQPVKRLSDGRCFITSQNHGYAVVSESMKGKGVLSYINANDFSCEGLDYPELGCFTVQFHPEAAGGPRDTGFLFDRFISMMGGKGNA